LSDFRSGVRQSTAASAARSLTGTRPKCHPPAVRLGGCVLSLSGCSTRGTSAGTTTGSCTRLSDIAVEIDEGSFSLWRARKPVPERESLGAELCPQSSDLNNRTVLGFATKTGKTPSPRSPETR
jgi:hypothetical protein